LRHPRAEPLGSAGSPLIDGKGRQSGGPVASTAVSAISAEFYQILVRQEPLSLISPLSGPPLVLHRRPRACADQIHRLPSRPGDPLYARLMHAASWARADDHPFTLRVAAAFQRAGAMRSSTAPVICVSSQPLVETSGREHFLCGRSISGAVDHPRCVNNPELEPKLCV
jgi:hypothetical protein